jgi:hypothetical protein
MEVLNEEFLYERIGKLAIDLARERTAHLAKQNENELLISTLERVRALLTPWRSQVWTVDLEAALAGFSFTEGKLFQPEAPTLEANASLPPKRLLGQPEAPKGQEECIYASCRKTGECLYPDRATDLGCPKVYADLAAANARADEAERAHEATLLTNASLVQAYERLESERDQLAARVKELEFLIALDRTDGTS